MRTCITFMRHKGMKNVILHSSLSPKERYYYDYIDDVPLSWIILCNEKWKIKILYSSNRIQISSTIFIHISKTLNRAWIYTYIHGDILFFFFLFFFFYKTTIRCLKQQGGFSSNAYSSHYRPYLGDEGKKLDTTTVQRV